MKDVAVQLGVLVGFEDVFEHAKLRLFLRLERLRIVEHLAVSVAQDVGGIPASNAELASLEHWSQHGLQKGLAGLEVFSANGDFARGRKISEHRDVNREVGGTIGKRDTFENGGIGVQHRGGDRGVVGVDGSFERCDVLVGRPSLQEDFG